PFATVASRPAPPAPAAPAQPAQGGGGGGAAPTARITSVDTSWSRVTLSNGQTLSISSHRDAVLSRNTGTLVVLYRAGEYWAYSGFRLAHNGTHYRMDSIGTSTTDSFGNPGIHRGTTRAGGGGAMFE
ncbi:MAG: hypothetical protein FWG66_00015, partial [Spirochaetes bacterium]|nr:hypothetical protein [Spirochaetota bacterium]